MDDRTAAELHRAPTKAWPPALAEHGIMASRAERPHAQQPAIVTQTHFCVRSDVARQHLDAVLDPVSEARIAASLLGVVWAPTMIVVICRRRRCCGSPGRARRPSVETGRSTAAICWAAASTTARA